jgi:curved DNA-binding protein CbpA
LIVGTGVRRRTVMAMRRDHYTLLGVSRTAEPAAIRSAFKQRALERHPDHAGAGAAGEFRELWDAYHVLADPNRRAAYDAELRDREYPPSAPVMDLRNGPGWLIRDRSEWAAATRIEVVVVLRTGPPPWWNR